MNDVCERAFSTLSLWCRAYGNDVYYQLYCMCERMRECISGALQCNVYDVRRCKELNDVATYRCDAFIKSGTGWRRKRWWWCCRNMKKEKKNISSSLATAYGQELFRDCSQPPQCPKKLRQNQIFSMNLECKAFLPATCVHSNWLPMQMLKNISKQSWCIFIIALCLFDERSAYTLYVQNVHFSCIHWLGYANVCSLSGCIIHDANAIIHRSAWSGTFADFHLENRQAKDNYYHVTRQQCTTHTHTQTDRRSHAHLMQMHTIILNSISEQLQHRDLWSENSPHAVSVNVVKTNGRG